MLTTGTRWNIRGNHPTMNDPASRVQGVFFALIQTPLMIMIKICTMPFSQAALRSFLSNWVVPMFLSVLQLFSCETLGQLPGVSPLIEISLLCLSSYWLICTFVFVVDVVANLQSSPSTLLWYLSSSVYYSVGTPGIVYLVPQSIPLLLLVVFVFSFGILSMMVRVMFCCGVSSMLVPILEIGVSMPPSIYVSFLL